MGQAERNECSGQDTEVVMDDLAALSVKRPITGHVLPDGTISGSGSVPIARIKVGIAFDGDAWSSPN